MNDPVSVITAKSIAVRLADDEVPLRVIARALMLPADEVRDTLHDAVASGRIIRVPRDDWHPMPRGQLANPPDAVGKMDDEELIFNCSRLFKVTRLQAAFMSVIIRKNEVSKELLHQVVETNRKNTNDADETDPKMVDVVICHLRKKLKPFGLEIKTVWACGYYMEPAMRANAQAFINSHRAEYNRGGP